MTKITTAVETWTKKKAEAALAKGGPNRKSSKNVIAKYATAMSCDQWEMNGETIKISTASTVLDGRHRLLAVIKSGKTVKMLTVRGLPKSTQKTVDDGYKRTLGHILQMRGEVNSTTLAYASTLLVRWEQEQLSGLRLRSYGARPLRHECLQALDKHSNIRDYVAHNATHNYKKIGSAGLFSFLWYVCSMGHPQEADDFFTNLSYGLELKRTDACYLLREKLTKARGENDPRKKLDGLHRLQLIIKAWNSTVDPNGPVLTQLKVPKTQDVPEIL